MGAIICAAAASSAVLTDRGPNSNRAHSTGERTSGTRTSTPLLGGVWDDCPDIDVRENPLDAETLQMVIPALCMEGVSLVWDDGNCDC